MFLGRSPPISVAARDYLGGGVTDDHSLLNNEQHRNKLVEILPAERLGERGRLRENNNWQTSEI